MGWECRSSTPRVAAVVLALLQAACDASLDPVGALPARVEPVAVVLRVEAESYTSLSLRDGAANFAIVDGASSQASDDPDPPHAQDASGQAYVEALPDTFTKEGEAIPGVSFFSVPGEGSTLTYRLAFASAGRYLVWLRAYAGGGKDNSAFIGLDGVYNPIPIQVCGPAGWVWTSSERDEAADGTCSEPQRAALTVLQPGDHDLQLSLREDGFELDQLLLTTDLDWIPQGISGSN